MSALASAAHAEDPAAHAQDQSLTLYGVTLYGTIDTGITYQSHGAPLSDYFYPGASYLISKYSNKSNWSLGPNGLSQSKIGLKGTEELTDGLSGIFKVEMNFVPTSGNFADALKSLTQANGVPLNQQTTNGDGSRAGQLFSGAAYGGLESTRFGTLTVGRQTGIIADNVAKYDPQGGSYAFSVIGYSGATAGGGDTQDARLDNSLKYLIQYGPLRFGALYQFSDATGNGGRAYQFDVGGDYAHLSIDFAYGHKKDAISASALSAEQVGALPALGLSSTNALAATVSDNDAYSIMALYDAGKPKIYAGYEYIRYSNPSNPLRNGTDMMGGYVIGAVNNTAYTDHKILQVVWAGLKYSVTKKFDVTGAWYHYDQNNYFGKVCVGTTHAQCAGTLNALSLVADYRFTKRFDMYAGVMWSEVANGLASGYLQSVNVSPMVGARFTF